MFKRIVVGADGSPEGRDAAALGAAIAAATSSGLTLLCAFPPYPVSGAGMDRRSQVRTAEHQLSADRRQFAPSAHIEAVADPDPARALLNNAQHWHADLVVIGSGHRAAIGRCTIGHTGRRLLNKMPPALAIAKRGLHESGAELRNIAVGYDGAPESYDGAPESESALQLADALAVAADAELLIHTVHRDAQLDALKIAKRAAARAAARSYVNPSIGDPGLLLRAFSDAVDVMVIGSRRWGPLARMVLGGVGEALATDCGSSLIIARAAAARRPALSKSPHGDPLTSATSGAARDERIVL